MHDKIDKDATNKESIFKGPVNQEFFTKVKGLENGIEIVTAKEGEEEEDQDEEASPGGIQVQDTDQQ